MQSIVFKRRDFREYDQIVSLYTKDKGKLDLLARGVKKTTSKNSAHLEPFSFIDIEIACGKEFDYLIKVQPLDYFTRIRKNYIKSLVANFAASLADKMLSAGERDENIFLLLKSWLKFIDRIRAVDITILDSFILCFFDRLGYGPILDRCVICSKSFREMISETLSRPATGKKGLPGFYFAGGGVVCNECRTEKESANEQMAVCGLKEASNMQVLLKGDWNGIMKYDFSEKEALEMHKLIYEFAVYHSEKDISDWRDIV